MVLDAWAFIHHQPLRSSRSGQQGPWHQSGCRCAVDFNPHAHEIRWEQSLCEDIPLLAPASSAERRDIASRGCDCYSRQRPAVLAAKAATTTIRLCSALLRTRWCSG